MFEGREVVRLEYEAYEEMAVKVINEIVDEVQGLHKVAVVHRLGVVPV